ncbi:unnamed protein product [Dibothriocephalus latus]|uniref:Apple domain-containing protein n=1 Tax=Dibothriocephalus latus TaxID=60516 RepID=A0A3P6UB90_DIBLA|nr:unnamed protein product [Dibothriocephalus latus]
MRSQDVPLSRNTSGAKGPPVELTLHSVASRILLGITLPLLFTLTVLVVYHVWRRIHGRRQYTTQFPKVYPHLQDSDDVIHHCRSRSVGHICQTPHANVPFYAKSPTYRPVRRHSCGWYASTSPADASLWTPASAPVMSMEELYVQPNAHLFFGHPLLVSRTPPSVQRQSTLSPIKELNGGEGSAANQTDSNGFHWLIMDLGAITSGITEIRLTLGAEKNAFGVEAIDVFTATYLHTNQLHQATQSTHVVDLPWDMYEFCNNTSNEFLTPYGAVVLCSPAKSGKWIILRRKTKSLYVCLLAIYVESTSHECFDEVAVSPDGSPAVSPGRVFRLERHVTHGQCRESCMETPVCQAIAFVHRRRTGMCYLLQQFNRTDDSSSADAAFICMHGRKCKIEENICHRGE